MIVTEQTIICAIRKLKFPEKAALIIILIIKIIWQIVVNFSKQVWSRVLFVNDIS